jgi:polysaccharide export outer membrane protein
MDSSNLANSGFRFQVSSLRSLLERFGLLLRLVVGIRCIRIQRVFRQMTILIFLRMFFLALLLLASLTFNLEVGAQTVTAPTQGMSQDELQLLLQQARELGLIPQGANLPSGMDAAALKNLLRKHEESKRAVPAAPATLTPAAPVAPSVIEQMFSKTPPTDVSRNLKQFGYEVFAQPSTTFAPTDAVSVGADYILAPGDEIVIYMWGKVAEGTQVVTVDKDGKILLPKVGPMPLAGMTFGQARELIVKRLQETYANTEITVTTGRLHTISITIIGEVAKPGTYQVSPFATLFNALYEAGGPTKMGSMRRIKLTRGNQSFVSDLYKFLTEGDRSQDYKLQANDVIFVPPIGQTVAVTGHVKRAAVFELAGETTGRDLLALAGGLLPGEGQRIQVERFRTAAGRSVEELRYKTREERDAQLAAFKIQDGDLLIVYPPSVKRHNFVTISGFVLHSGDYEFQPDLKIKDLLERAGGVTPSAFLKRVEITRTLHDRPAEIIRVDVKDILDDKAEANVALKEYDSVRVYDYGFVTVSGMVWKPDRYQWVAGMTVKEALEKAGGVKEGAWLKRGEIVRLRTEPSATEDDEHKRVAARVLMEKPLSPIQATAAGTIDTPPAAVPHSLLNEVIPFNVAEALAGNKAENKVLEEFDVIKIYDTADVLPSRTVSIAGAVYKPGTYALTPKMTITDLIFKAGGLRRNALAEKIEVFRTEIGHQPRLFTLDLTSALEGTDKSNDLPLEDLDTVYVRRNADLDKRNRIVISGEVRFPGEYVAEPGESLSSILKRAGGFTEKAYLPAAVFKRAAIRDSQRAMAQQFVEAQRRTLLREQATQPLGEVSEAERKMRETMIEFRRQLIDLVAAADLPGRMVIRLDTPDKLKGTRDDVLIEDGDTLHIPQTPATVQVAGAVYNATALIFENGKNLDYYLAKVGGPTREADKNQIYVIKANGEVNYKFARVTPIERGDTIVVPLDVRPRTPWMQLLVETSKVIANLAIGAAVATK